MKIVYCKTENYVDIPKTSVRRTIDWLNSTYKSFKDVMFPISFGIVPLNSFHMKSLPEEKKTKYKTLENN